MILVDQYRFYLPVSPHISTISPHFGWLWPLYSFWQCCTMPLPLFRLVHTLRVMFNDVFVVTRCMHIAKPPQNLLQSHLIWTRWSPIPARTTFPSLEHGRTSEREGLIALNAKRGVELKRASHDIIYISSYLMLSREISTHLVLFCYTWYLVMYTLWKICFCVYVDSICCKWPKKVHFEADCCTEWINK